jgi:hypothetical protein
MTGKFENSEHPKHPERHKRAGHLSSVLSNFFSVADDDEDDQAGAGTTYRSGWISTIDLLVRTSSDQLYLLLYFCIYKASYLSKEVKCTEASLSVRFPWPEHVSLVSFSSLVTVI